MRRSTIFPRQGVARIALIIAASALLPVHKTNAQVVSPQIQSDIEIFRTDALVKADRRVSISSAAFIAPTYDGEPRDYGFTVNLLGPILYNSNAQSANSGGTHTPEYTPEVRLAWAQSFPTHLLRLSAILDAASDRFPGASAANSDAAYAKVRVQYDSGADDQEWEPFLQYSPTFVLEPLFKKKDASSQAITLGFDKAFNFDRYLKRISRPRPDSSRGTLLSLGMTGTLTRRTAHPSPDAWIITASPSVTWNATGTRGGDAFDPKLAQWNISLEVDISRTIYDKLGSFSRQDTLVSPVLTVEFQPPLRWFSGYNEQEQDDFESSVGRPKIDFQLQWAKLSTDSAGNSFQQWVVGPSIKAAWNF